MTKLFLKRIFSILVAALIFLDTGAISFAAASAPHTIMYVEADQAYVNIDGANAQAIAERISQVSVDNGYVWIFSKVNNKNLDSALKRLDKEYDLNQKKIKDIEDVDPLVLQEASNYLHSEQFSVLRVELEEKSNRSTEETIRNWAIGIGAAAALIQAFK